MTPKHAEARRLATEGIPVFPCVVGGKEPACEGGFHASTTDLEIIDGWWQKEDYNIGLCPANAGWCVVDVDPGGLEQWENLSREHGNPRTTVVRTPRGGFHVYYAGDLPPTASKIGTQIDTRGIGSYVLVPPSSVGGRSYEWIDTEEFAYVPTWIVEAATKASEKTHAAIAELDLQHNRDRASAFLRDCVTQGEVAIEGQGGDNKTYAVACEVLNFGLTPETAVDLIDEIWNPHCVPPWSRDELSVKIENASHYAQNEAGAWALPPTREAIPALDKYVSASVSEKRSRFYPEDEKEQDTEAEPQWLVKNLLQYPSTAMMVGPTQSYKSFLALDLALAIASGSVTFGAAPMRGDTVYAALEGRAGIKRKRRGAWKIARGIEDVPNFYVSVAPMIAVPGEMEEFSDQLVKRGIKPRLIVIDTLSKSMAGLNENDARDANLFVRFCDGLVERFGCTVLAVHHKGKDDARGARGSSAFHAGFDTVLEIIAHPASKAVECWARKHKDADEPETPWTFQMRAVGTALVAFETSASEHRALTARDDLFDGRKIGAALQSLKAYGQDGAITTNVLAAHLCTPVAGESQEAREGSVNIAARKLRALSRTKLEAYCSGSGRDLSWYLPAPATQE